MENIIKDIDVLQKTPGQILRTARESSSISIEEVSQALLLNKSVINALEADDYSSIVAKVYAEGYLKAYAIFLQLPVTTVLESFRDLNIYHDNDNEIKSIKSHMETSNNTKSTTGLIDLFKNKKSFVLLMTFVGLFCLVFVIAKLTLVKTPVAITPSVNNTTVTSVFPIAIENSQVSVPQVAQIEAPKNKKLVKAKIKAAKSLKPKLELLDKNPEDLNNDVAQ